MRRNSNRRKIKLFFYLLLIILLVGSYFFFKRVQEEYISINTFEECVSAGYKVMATYPEQCKIPGKVFINTTQTASVDTEGNELASYTTNIEKNTNPKNSSYDIEGQMIILKNGEMEITSGSSSTNKIKYFGNELRVDLNGDSKEDSAFLLTTNNGGTGIFYYLVVAINKEGTYSGTNGVFIGDRIAPQTTEFRNGEIVVNYADRRIDEPMSTKPSIGVSRYFKINNDTLVEIQK